MRIAPIIVGVKYNIAPDARASVREECSMVLVVIITSSIAITDIKPAKMPAFHHTAGGRSLVFSISVSKRF